MKELVSKLEELKAVLNDCIDMAKGSASSPKKAAPGESEPDGDEESSDDFGNADSVASKLGLMSLKDKLK